MREDVLPQVYKPYLLMNKKRYAGLLWTNSEKYDKMDTKVHTSAQLSDVPTFDLLECCRSPHFLVGRNSSWTVQAAVLYQLSNHKL